MTKRPNPDDFHEKLQQKIDEALPGKFVFIDYVRALEAYIDHIEGACAHLTSLVEEREARIKRVAGLMTKVYSKEQWMDFTPEDRAGLIMSYDTGEKAVNTHLLSILENWENE